MLRHPRAQRLHALMRTLIRSRTTKAFLTREGSWTENIRSGAQFHSHAKALVETQRLNLSNVELYYAFGEKRETPWDFAIPLLPGLSHAPPFPPGNRPPLRGD